MRFLIPITMLISLLLFSSSMNQQVVPLPNNRYKIQVNRTLFLPQDNIFGIPLRTHDELFRSKASEIFKGYTIVGTEIATSFWRGSTTKSWIIECVEK